MTQKDWEKAIEKFVSKWEKRKEVLGIIVCGSYVTGNPSKHSDIDTVILTSEKTKWRERGNEYIDGFLVEYFANPFKQNLKYLKEEHNERKRILRHMLITGKVVLDKNGDAKKLIKKAHEWEKKKFKPVPKVLCEINKYVIWDLRDNLEEIYQSKSMEFYMVYYVHLEKLFQKYSAYLKHEKYAVHKIKRFLTCKKDLQKYRLEKFPDKKFSEMFMKTMKLKNKKDMMRDYDLITEYVLEKMGGFEIDRWKVRSKLE